MTATPASPTPVGPKPAFNFWEFVRFVATGAVAAVVNLTVATLCRMVMPFPVALIIGYVAGMIVAFYMFQKIIFRDPTGPVGKRMFRFTVVNLVGLALSWCVSMMMAYWVLPAMHWTFHPEFVANAVGIAVPAVSSYFGHKHYTYK